MCIKQRIFLWILLVTLGQGDIGQIVEHSVLHPAPVLEASVLVQRNEILAKIQEYSNTWFNRSVKILEEYPSAVKIAGNKEYAWRHPVRVTRQTASHVQTNTQVRKGRYTVLYKDADIALKEGSHTFYKGQCTRYVGSKYSIDWGGNAEDWLTNAAKAGHTITDTPEAGDIFVSDESAYGHTGIVKGIDTEKGVMIVEDMNYAGYGVVTEREVPLTSSRIKGFIDASSLSESSSSSS